MVARASHKADIEAYIDGVLSGRIVAGKLCIAAVERHLDDLEHAGDRGYYFDEQAANNAIEFFPLLKHTTGRYSGQSFQLRMWQKFPTWVLFGWKQSSDNFRRFRDAFLSLARGQGKTPMGAGYGLLLACADQPLEARAEVLCCATKRDQARKLFNEAKRFVGGCSLKKYFTDYTNKLIFTPNLSTFEPLGSDCKTEDGWIVHGVIRDELHEWTKFHRPLYEKLETAMAKRDQPLAITITTAGHDKSDVWHEQYDFSVKAVHQRGCDETNMAYDQHFSFICEVDKDDDVFDEANWPKANPMLNEPESTVKIDALRGFAAKAREMPDAELTFRRYYCNQRVATFSKVITPDMWRKGAGALPDLKNRRCFAGFDWGWRNDLAALGLVFPIDGKLYLKAYCWIPSGCKRDLQREPWANFIKSGELTVTEGDTTDPDAIYATMEHVIKEYEVASLAYDPNNAREFSTKCVNQWGIQTYDFRQTTVKYNEPMRGFMNDLNSGEIIHGNSALLAWSAGNLVCRTDNKGYIMPDKEHSDDKIDPLVALIMAYSESKFSDVEELNYYESHSVEIG